MKRELTGRLAGAAGRVEAAIEARLSSSAADGVPPRLLDAMRHGALGGGKRLRPFLVIECAALFGVGSEQALPAAAALELVHCYSLIHDDLPAMDNDTMRRGRPTVWKAFDEWSAILAGDGLLTLAFEVLASPGCHPDPGIRSELCLLLARAAGPAGMVGGQALDLAAEKRGEPPHPSKADITRLQAMKTGALIRYACEAGAVLGGADGRQRQALIDFGHHIGVAFQLADDLLDVEGAPEVVGKAVGKDAAAGKATLISLMGLEAARAALADAETAALAALDQFAEGADVLRETARFVASRSH